MTKKTSRRVVYMHTIDGQPAEYWPDQQIAFVGGSRPLSHFADSLYQIRREQRASDKWRLKQGMSVDGFDYGYIRVRLPHV